MYESCMWCFAFVLFGHLHGMKQELYKISNCFLRRPTERTIYYLIISWESNFANPVSFRFMMKIAFVFWRKDINQNEPLILRYYGLGVVFSSSILTRLEETHNVFYCPWLQLILKHWQTHFVVFAHANLLIKLGAVMLMNLWIIFRFWIKFWFAMQILHIEAMNFNPFLAIHEV